MPIFEITTYNKHKIRRTRKFYHPTTNIGFSPDKMGNFIFLKLFKYPYEGIFPPSITKVNNKNYIVPGWVEVLEGTELSDVEWIKPKESPKTKSETLTFKFKSSSSDKEYITKKYIYSNGDVKYSCNCPGVWRAKNRECKHILNIIKNEN